MPAVSAGVAPAREAAPPTVASPPISPAKPPPPAPTIEARRSENYYQVKATIFGALIEAIDLAQVSPSSTANRRARKSAISSTRSSRSRTS